MVLSIHRERRLLQIGVFFAALVPITAGTLGMLHGCALVETCANASLDNHFRYLSGLLAGLGLSFWWMIPHVERHGPTVRVLTGMVVLGGIARLVSALLVARPSDLMLAAIVMELVVTPLMCLWQARIARRYL